MREMVGLPTLKAQEAALRSAGIDDWGDLSPVYVILSTKRKPRKDARDQWQDLLMALRPGEDEVVIASAAVLGGTRKIILESLQAIGARGCGVYDVEADERVAYNPAGLAMIALAERGESQTRSAALTKARKRRAELGREHGPLVKFDKDKHPKAYAAACKIWLNLDHTAKQAAVLIGASVSTCYRLLPNREAPIFGRKPKK